MGSPKLWQMLAPAAETRSLLDLTTIEGFLANNRGLRTLIVGVDISIRIEAIIAALKAAGVFPHGSKGQKLVFERLFYQLCNLSMAPITCVFVFDGPGRPPIKRGTRVVHRPAGFIQHLKEMITAFGFYFYDAPGEAEAELAHLNTHGKLDAIISEDSDAFVFGAQCVIRTTGPYVEHKSLIYTRESIENTDSVALDKDGLLLCVLLFGGDYGKGIPGAGKTIARVLSALGFGRHLAHILRSLSGPALTYHLSLWRNSLCRELRTNPACGLKAHRLNVADKVSNSFPNLQIAYLYLNPKTSFSLGFTGQAPECAQWRPREIDIFQVSHLCSAHFAWHGEDLLKKLTANLWPAVTFKLISSRHVLYNPSNELFASPTSQATLLKADPPNKTKKNRASSDSSHLDIRRVRVSANNFRALAQLSHLPAIPDSKIKLVSIPAAILAVAMRDAASPTTDVSDVPHMDYNDIGEVTNMYDVPLSDVAATSWEDTTSNGFNSHGHDEGGNILDIMDSDEDFVAATSWEDTTSNGFSSHDNDKGGSVLDIMDSDEEDLANVHRALGCNGVIDLTEIL